MAWLARSIGQFGNDAGEAAGIVQDRRAKQQQMDFAKVKQQLDMLMLPLQIKEIQQRLQQGGQAQPAGTVGTRGGGTAGLTFDRNTGKYSEQQLEGGADPEAVKAKISGMKTGVSKEFQSAIQSHIDAIDAGADPLKELAGAQKDLESNAIKATPGGTTLNRLQAKYHDQVSGGDVQGAEDTMKEIREIQKSMKQSTPTMWGTIAGAQQGDPDAIARLKLYYDGQKELVKERGLAFGQGRLFGLQNAWVDGVNSPMTGFEVLQAKRDGKDVTIGGPLSATTRIAYQQLYAEAGPALSEVEKYLKAYDNPGDRAIFAAAKRGAGPVERGNELEWFRNMFSQIATDQLSPEGKHLKISLARLGETMGRFRGVAGLQATDSAMAITMMMLPGNDTPNMQYAKWQTDSLRQMIQQAGGIPAMRNQGQGGLNNLTPTQPIIPPPPNFTKRVQQ